MTSTNKITNATSDRELILIWLGGKSETTQISYRSTVEKFIEFIAKPASFKNGVFWVTNAGEIKPSCNLA